MQITIKIVLVVTILSLSLLISGCETTEKPLTAAEYYDGKSIKLVVSGSPGSYIDLASRILAAHLSEDIKGNVIVENMRGAGGLEAMNYLYEATPDGLTLGTVATGKFIPNKILNDPAALYEINGFSYLLKIDNSQIFFVVSPDGPYQSINDLQSGVDIKIAAGTASGSFALAGVTIVDLLELDAKVVTGFDDSAARSLATQRGEVVGYTTYLGTVKAELEAGTLKPLFVIANHRDPASPDIPAITELVSLSEEDTALVELWENGLSSGTILAGPAGISKDKLDYLCNLIDEWCQDENFREEINQVAGYEILEYTSKDFLIESLYDIASSLESFQSRFTEMINKYRM